GEVDVRTDSPWQRASAKNRPNAHGIDQTKLDARIRHGESRRLSPALTLTLALNPLPNLPLHLSLSLLWRPARRKEGPCPSQPPKPWRRCPSRPPTWTPSGGSPSWTSGAPATPTCGPPSRSCSTSTPGPRASPTSCAAPPPTSTPRGRSRPPSRR